MTGFATNLHRLKLPGLDVTVSHNIRLRMAVNAFHSPFQMNVHAGLAASGKGEFSLMIALWKRNGKLFRGHLR